MSSIRELRRSAEVGHPAHQMYALVNDVESYPLFLPWCVSARVLERRPDAVLATLEMSLAGIHRAVTTQNLLEPPGRVTLELVEGPFSHFHGQWSFTDLSGSPARSRVTLELSYALMSRLLGAAVGPVLGSIADSLVSAFCRRADAVYPPAGA